MSRGDPRGRSAPTGPVTPAPVPPKQKAGRTALPDAAQRATTPGERVEPTLALALTATAGVVVWALGAPRQASIPLLALPAVAALALVAPTMRGGRLLRGLALLAAAAVAGVEAPALVPVTVLIVIATAAVYPGLLAGTAAARVITLGSILALAVPLSGQLIRAGLAPTADPLADLNDFLAGGTDPEATATRLALVGGIAVVAVLGWAGVVNRRTLAQIASLAESRARDARQATAELARATARDVLTGLANRDGLISDTTRALSRMSATGHDAARPALAVFDIDRFTTLVDSAGPDVAEEVIRQLAARLRTAADPGFLVAHSGRHQFAVLLGEANDDTATRTARRLGTVFDVPLTVGSHELFVTCSTGVAVAGHGVGTAEALLHAAQEAARVARQRGRSRIVTSDQALRAHTASQARMEVELRDAVRRQQVGLAYQPVLGLGRDDHHDAVVAVEALARWTRDDRSVVPPKRFIPLADELGLGVTLGLRLVDEALDRLVAWRHAGYAVDQMWLNLAPSQLLDPEFAHMVSARLAARSVPATSLLVEIGADTFVESDQATSTLGMLRSLGVVIALDDFGKTGLSLTALRHLPITHVKLDHELAPDFTRAHGVAAAATNLCRTLGLRVIAEGIETKAQLEGARGAGVDAVQGFAVAGTLAPHEVSPYLRASRPGVTSRPPG